MDLPFLVYVHQAVVSGSINSTWLWTLYLLVTEKHLEGFADDRMSWHDW